MADHRNVSVIGAGDMGHGLAVHFALQGQAPTLIDHRQSNLDAAQERIKQVVSLLNNEDITSANPSEVIETISFTLNLEMGVSEADIVLESVSEDRTTKQEILSNVATSAPEDAILASNTSGIPITDIAESLSEASDRLIGCHWWNPPYLLTPVEIVLGENTNKKTREKIVEFIEEVDRDPILVENDVPGFVWNRVQFAVFRECMHLLEEEVASAEDINRAIRDGYAARTAVIGPFETIDVNGLDLIETIAGDLYPNLSNASEPSELLSNHLEKGNSGVEAGRGFFEYNQSFDEKLADRDVDIAAIRKALETQD